MDSGRINNRWSRPLRNVSKKRRKTGLMNYAKRKNKEIGSKVEPGESLTASGLNSIEMPAYNNDANNIEINCSVTKPINVDEEIANRAIVKEEIDIKDEVCDHSMFEITELNITPDLSSSESNPDSNNAHSNATPEFAELQNIRIGIDESLIGRHVKGIFSSETIGSKTLIVFRRLPGEPELTVPEVVNEKELGCSKHEKADKLYKNSSVSRKIHFMGEHRKAILKGKYTKFCSKCKIPLESDSAVNCNLCAAKYHFSCKQCNETFDNYFTLSQHIFMRCIPQGYYICPECCYKSRCFNIVRKHILSLHPHLGLDFDLRSIEWKDVARDENGSPLLMHICQNCGRAFRRLPNYNIHTGICHKIRGGLKSISTNDDSCPRDDENPPSQEDDVRKKIVLHCEKCNKDTKFYHFLNCQPNCIDCQSKLKFRCTLCNELIDTDSRAARHLRLTCDSRQKIKCKFCEKNFLYEHNLLKHEKMHLKTARRQVESKKTSLDEADKFPDSSKNEMHSNKSTMSTCEEEKESAKFSSNQDLTKQSIESQRQSHSKISKRQIVVLPSKKKSLDQAKNFPEYRKNEIDSSEKSTMSSTCEKEKRNSKSIPSEKRIAKFSNSPDLTRQQKYCEKKLQMQCKVLLARLTINKS